MLTSSMPKTSTLNVKSLQWIEPLFLDSKLDQAEQILTIHIVDLLTSDKFTLSANEKLPLF